MKLVCLGDSMTYGYGVSRGQAWPILLQALIHEPVLNLGLNGDTTGGMLCRLGTELDREKPTHVIIMGGVNDLMMAVPQSVVSANFSAMVHQGRSRGIQIILGIPHGIIPDQARTHWPPLFDYESLPKQLLALRLWLRDFAVAFNVPVVDFYETLEKWSEPQRKSFYLDGLHLNEAGHRILAEEAQQFWKKKGGGLGEAF